MADTIAVPKPDDYYGDDPAGLADQLEALLDGDLADPLKETGLSLFGGEWSAVIAALRASAPKAL